MQCSWLLSSHTVSSINLATLARGYTDVTVLVCFSRSINFTELKLSSSSRPGSGHYAGHDDYR